jgi:subtilisin family serine protease
VLWGARLVDLKVSSNRDDSMDVSTIIEAIDYAVGLGQVRVVNCSFGGGAYSQAEHEAFLRLAQAKILAVCSAGNSGWDSDLPGQENYPSGYEAGNIVSVTASDRFNRLAPFANFGRRSVDVIAPGVDIVTTEALGQGAAPTTLASGTSIAAPVLSGLAAILRAVAPDLDYDRLRSMLIHSAVPSPELTGKAASSGVVDAWLALQLAWPPADLNGDRQVTLADPLLGLSWLAGGWQGRPSPSWLAPDRGPALARIITSLQAIAQINPMPRGAEP